MQFSQLEERLLQFSRVAAARHFADKPVCVPIDLNVHDDGLVIAVPMRFDPDLLRLDY